MVKECTSIIEHIGFGGFFVFEIILTPYYVCEETYYRAQNRMKKYYR